MSGITQEFSPRHSTEGLRIFNSSPSFDSPTSMSFGDKNWVNTPPHVEPAGSKTNSFFTSVFTSVPPRPLPSTSTPTPSPPPRLAPMTKPSPPDDIQGFHRASTLPTNMDNHDSHPSTTLTDRLRNLARQSSMHKRHFEEHPPPRITTTFLTQARSAPSSPVIDSSSRSPSPSSLHPHGRRLSEDELLQLPSPSELSPTWSARSQPPSRPGSPLLLPPSALRKEVGTDDDDSPTETTFPKLSGFETIQLLGVGAFSKVYLAKEEASGTQFAVKLTEKERIRRDQRLRQSVEREREILSRAAECDGVVKLFGEFETDKVTGLVLEYLRGGELFEWVERLGRKEINPGERERIVKIIFKQLVGAVSFLHENNIVHRDLKLENVLLVEKDSHLEDTKIKISDFGLAKIIDPNAPLITTRCGSEEYAAPEILQNKPYDGRRTDTWALGVILYALLTGELPFTYAPERGERVSQLFYRICGAVITWKGRWAGNVSQEARDVVEKILVVNPEKRITLGEIKKMKWMVGEISMDQKEY